MLFLDADEFIFGDSADIDLCDVAGSVCQFARFRYMITSPEDTSANVLMRMRYYLPDPDTDKYFIRVDREKYTNYRVGTGNHKVRVAGEVRSDGKAIITIAHFPIRSIDQYVSKVVGGWISLLLERKINVAGVKVNGSHWRSGYEFAMKHDLAIPPDEFESCVNREYDKEKFILAPVNDTLEMRYADLARPKSIAYTVLKSYEKTIRDIWEERVGREAAEKTLGGADD